MPPAAEREGKQISVWLDDEIFKQLEKRAESEDRSLASVVRFILRQGVRHLRTKHAR